MAAAAAAAVVVRGGGGGGGMPAAAVAGCRGGGGGRWRGRLLSKPRNQQPAAGPAPARGRRRRAAARRPVPAGLGGGGRPARVRRRPPGTGGARRRRQPPGGVGGAGGREPAGGGGGRSGGIGGRPGVWRRRGSARPVSAASASRGIGGSTTGRAASAASAASATDRASIAGPAASAASAASGTDRASIARRRRRSVGVGDARWRRRGRQPTRHRQPARRRRRRRRRQRPGSTPASADGRHRQSADVGSGNTINRGDVNVGGIRQNNLAGVGVDPGYGVRPPAYNNWRGAYWGYHQGWANGYWHGYHDNNNWGWGRFATGAAAGVTAWALGSSFYNWGYASYANPYYAEAPVAEPIVIEQTIAGGEPQTVSVPALAYDYSQPIDTQSAPPAAEVADPAIAKFDSAREAFRTGDYAGALRLTDEALKVLPNDATLHEFRALVLFAVGKYDLAAGPLYAVLSVGPGWDWTTMAGLYPDIDVYTAQLRKLEAFVTANPTSTAGRFVLAYHYLTQGNIDAAVAQLKQVVALAPQDTLSAQLIKQFSTPGSEARHAGASDRSAAARATPAKPGNLPGNWTAHPAERHDDRPGHRGRRGLHLDGRPPRASPATRGEVVAHQRPAHARPGRGKAGPWSAASPGRPTTGGPSASSGRGPRIKGWSSPTEKAGSSGTEWGTGRMRSGSPRPVARHFRCWPGCDISPRLFEPSGARP